jgi:hypothetical protein
MPGQDIAVSQLPAGVFCMRPQAQTPEKMVLFGTNTVNTCVYLLNRTANPP